MTIEEFKKIVAGLPKETEIRLVDGRENDAVKSAVVRPLSRTEADRFSPMNDHVVHYFEVALSAISQPLAPRIAPKPEKAG